MQQSYQATYVAFTMEYVKMSFRITCEYARDVMPKMFTISACRLKALEIASYRCNFTLLAVLNIQYEVELLMESNITHLEALKRFTLIEWLQDQSFCYENSPSVILYPTMMNSGLCYSFNVGEEMFDKST